MWKERCKNLAELCEASAWATDPESVYQCIVDAGVRIFECDGAHLHLLAVDGNSFVRHASHTDALAMADRASMLSVGVGRTKWMILTRNPVFMDYMNPHAEDVVPKSAVDLGYKSAVSIPILAGNNLLGMYSLVYKRTLPWTEDDQDYLLDIGRVLGVLIQRIQMSKKDAELKLLSERKRLSSEIHDNLSQLVSSIALDADAALISCEEGSDAALRADLERLGQTTRRTMKVLREEMLSLRTPLERTDGLTGGIRDALERFERQWGIETHLDIRTSEPVIVSMQTPQQLVRILNECLSNTLRHADASCIRATLEEDDRNLSLVVQDDGCGFDVSAVAPERLGIRIMRERAAAAGGSLTLLSDEQGTTVCVDVPRSA